MDLSLSQQWHIFIYGLNDESTGGGRFSALGEFEIERVTKSTVRMKLIGERLITSGPWDGWYCGRKCGERELAGLRSITEFVEFERLKTGGYIVRNRSEQKMRALPFSDMYVRLSTL